MEKELENLLALYQASTNAEEVQQMEVQQMEVQQEAERERERATQPEPYIEPDRHDAYGSESECESVQ